MKRLAMLLPLALVAAAALGAAPQDSFAEIQQRFQQRYRELFTLRIEGKVGETYEGYVALVAEVYGTGTTKALVEAENRDRKLYYELLAKDLENRGKTDDGEPITAAQVGRRNGARNLENARPTEYFRMADGVWVKVPDAKAYAVVLRLKADGIVGESADGYLAVRRDDGADMRAAERTNERRTAFYAAIAKVAEKPAETIAASYGRAYLESARPGDWILDVRGNWSRVAAEEP